jgi:hypothetical protein
MPRLPININRLFAVEENSHDGQTSVINGQACPWCDKTSGYRQLTSQESRRLMSTFLVQGTALGVIKTLGGLTDPARVLSYFRGLQTAGSELCCVACDRIVRVCPQCDTITRFVSAEVQTCGNCGTAFL